MRVFVAGATGAVGAPTVRLLVAAGHDVVGLTRSTSKRAFLEKLGVTPAVGDVLDGESIRRAVADAKPDAILSLLTRLPKNGPTQMRHMRPNARIHREGTANMVRAAEAAGVERLIAESVVFRYGYGDLPRMLRETDAPADPVGKLADAALEGVKALERSVLGANGIVLRYGLFYGKDTGHQQFMAKLLKRGLMRLPRDDRGALSWLHVDDAAAATVAALQHGRAGEIYNVADDEPVSFTGFTNELARAIGAKPPKSVPLGLVKAVMPYLAVAMTSTVTVSNDKAKRELGWTPRYVSIREGLSEMRAT